MGHCTLKSHGLEGRRFENGKLFFNEPLGLSAYGIPVRRRAGGAGGAHWHLACTQPGAEITRAAFDVLCYRIRITLGL
jgi:hypothetical protein